MAKEKYLVIVESPNKIESVKSYLGPDYKVMASVGHIVYLPASGPERLGVDIETWTPNYKIDPKKKEIVEKLKAATAKVDVVYLATDRDREGEAIAENLVEFLKPKKYYRMRFNEITKDAILASLEKKGTIDEALVDSQIARRILDRVIGFKLSKLMKNKIDGAPIAPSAGRVQSIALKLVIEKELIIEAFIPTRFFLLKGVIADNVEANYYNPKNDKNLDWINPDDIDEVFMSLKGELKVENVKTSTRKDAKPTPLKQSALYKRADSKLGMGARSVQSSAQRLYEGYGQSGLISYPRTDSTRLSDYFVKKAQEYIVDKFGKDFLDDTVKGVAGDQDAHEAIRPTDLTLTPDLAKEKYSPKGFGPNEYKLYKLIYEHTLQAMMTPPVREIIRYELKDGNHQFKMTSSRITFEGYYKLIGVPDLFQLPVYKIGESIPVKEYIKTDNHTKPPARYNDGSLIEKLDDIKVGRPSTFASTVSILKDREYVDMQGKALVPTVFGKTVFKKLESGFTHVMNPEYTAEVENKLDEIAEGKYARNDLLNSFWAKFEDDFLTATISLDVTKLLPIMAGKDCLECGGAMIVKRNKFNNQKFFACSNFPECKYTESDPSEKKKKFFGFKKK